MGALRRSILLTAALAAVAAIGFAGPAAAQGYAGSTIVVVAMSGNTAHVSGSGWQAGSLITVTIASDPVVLGTVTASASGTFSQGFTIPCLSKGTHTITASGIAADGTAKTSATQVTTENCVVVAGAASVAGVRSLPFGVRSLPFTGSNDTFPLIGVGIGLVLVGAVLAVVTQRRHNAHSINA